MPYLVDAYEKEIRVSDHLWWRRQCAVWYYALRNLNTNLTRTDPIRIEGGTTIFMQEVDGVYLRAVVLFNNYKGDNCAPFFTFKSMLWEEALWDVQNCTTKELLVFCRQWKIGRVKWYLNACKVLSVLESIYLVILRFIHVLELFHRLHMAYAWRVPHEPISLIATLFL